MNERDILAKIMQQQEQEKKQRIKEVEEEFDFDAEMERRITDKYQKMANLPGFETIVEDALAKIRANDEEELKKQLRSVEADINYLSEKSDTEEEYRYLIKLDLIKKELKKRI